MPEPSPPPRGRGPLSPSPGTRAAQPRTSGFGADAVGSCLEAQVWGFRLCVGVPARPHSGGATVLQMSHRGGAALALGRTTGVEGT